MQVCQNGHVITHRADSEPNMKQAFCAQCGSKTIDACPGCTQPIPGHHHMEDMVFFDGDEPPKYCVHCGAAYPWQAAAVENLVDLIREGELSEHDAQELENALPDIMQDTPRTQSAALKLNRLLPKLGATVYGVAIKVVSDVASETAKKALGLSV
jgi:hypothetical protein